MRNVLLISLLVFLGAFSVEAQDTIVTIVGDTVRVNKVEIDLEMRELVYKKDNGRYGFIDFDDVYHIRQSNGELFKYYKKDLDEGNVYTYEEMGDYISGVCYARENYKATAALLIGIGVGAASAPLISELELNPILIPVLPFSYALIKGLVEPKAKMIDASAYSEEFLYGYKDKVKSRRFNNAILGALSSSAVSTLIMVLVK